MQVYLFLWPQSMGYLIIYHTAGNFGRCKFSNKAFWRKFYFHMSLPNATPPCRYFLDGERGYIYKDIWHCKKAAWLPCSEAYLHANHYPLLECELAVLPCWLPCVVVTLLTSTHHAFHCLIITARLRYCRQGAAKMKMKAKLVNRITAF